MKPIVTWIVVADGAHAKIFANDGPGKGIQALPDLNREQDALHAREIMADKPGRSFSSAGPGTRSSIEYHTDPVEIRERRFVEDLAHRLEASRAQGAFQRLVIAAAPNALGDLRPALSDAVRKTVVAELAKDLTNVPIPKLAEHLDGVISL